MIEGREWRVNWWRETVRKRMEKKPPIYTSSLFPVPSLPSSTPSLISHCLFSMSFPQLLNPTAGTRERTWYKREMIGVPALASSFIHYPHLQTNRWGIMERDREGRNVTHHLTHSLPSPTEGIVYTGERWRGEREWVIPLVSSLPSPALPSLFLLSSRSPAPFKSIPWEGISLIHRNHFHLSLLLCQALVSLVSPCTSSTSSRSSRLSTSTKKQKDRK